MANLTRDKQGTYAVQYRDTDDVRRTIRIGRVSPRLARATCAQLEKLIASRAHGHEPERDMLDWIASIDAKLRKRIVAAGLAGLDPRLTITVSNIIERFMKLRQGVVKKGTMTRLEQSMKSLRTAMGGRPIVQIMYEDAASYRAELLRSGLAEATARKRCSDARSVFKLAIKAKIIEDNPFDGIPVAAIATKRTASVSIEDARRVLDELPSAQWRLLFALARWGALRIPSEARSLTWADIDWTRGRMLIHGKGGEDRTIPIFGEVEPLLQAVFDECEDGEMRVLPMLYKAKGEGGTVRNGLVGAIRRAGLKPWPRLWHNLRATRATELADQFAPKVVLEWCGHDMAVALAHYHRVTDEHFEKARKGGKEARQIPTPQLHEISRTEDTCSAPTND